MIEWNEDYCVGEDTIDAQHKALVSFYNDFCSHEEWSVSTAFVKASLHRMLALLIEHTEYEERYIRDHNFSFYKKDIDIHNRLIGDVGKLLAERDDVGFSIQKKVVELIDVWWKDYVLEEIKLLKKEMAEKNN